MIFSHSKFIFVVIFKMASHDSVKIEIANNKE